MGTLKLVEDSSKDFDFDVEQEKVIIECLQETLFKKYLTPVYKVQAESVSFDKDSKTQFAGVDLKIVSPNTDEIKLVDVKAQTNNYLGAPTNTFCLELGSANKKFKRPGWWLNPDLDTTHYLFVWITECNAKTVSYTSYTGTTKTRKIVESPADILKYHAMIVNVQHAHEWLSAQGCTDDVCREAVKMLQDNAYALSVKDPNKGIARIYFDFMARKLTKEQPWHGRYVSFTRTLWASKEEQPINLVVRNSYWSEIANAEYWVTPNTVKKVSKKQSSVKTA